MMKSYFFLMIPIILNLLMILFISIPMKMNKFHPISMMINLIFLSLITCLKMNFMMKSMISFITFLIMIGGLMVIFMYITSLTNNELFSFNLNLLKMNLLKMSSIIILLLLYYFYFYLFMEIQIFESFQMSFPMKFNLNLMNIIYKENYNKSTYFMMIYLFYSMICIMNICYKLKSPLRQLTF